MYISNPRDSSEDPDHVHPGNAQIQKTRFLIGWSRTCDESTAIHKSRPLVHTTIACRGVNRFREELTIYM